MQLLPRRNRAEVLMLSPAIVLLALISLFPLVYIIYLSFLNFASISNPIFNGLNNWVTTFKDSVFWGSWLRTIAYAGAGLVVEMVLGIAVALLIYELPRGNNIVLTLWMLPLFVAPIVSGLLSRFLLNSTYGLYAWLLSLIGVHTVIFGSTGTAMPAVILVDVWEWTPLITIIVLAGLQSLPIDVMEAADLDGARYRTKLFHIILPMTSQAILVALLIRSMDILRYVTVIYITTEGGPADSTKVIGYRLMEVAFRFQNFGNAAVIGLTMLVVTIVLGQFFVKVLYRSGGVRE